MGGAFQGNDANAKLFLLKLIKITLKINDKTGDDDCAKQFSLGTKLSCENTSAMRF